MSLAPYYAFLGWIVLLSGSGISVEKKEPTNNYSPAKKTLLHKIGDTQVRIVCEQYGPVKNRVFVHLHGDEETSLLGSRPVIASDGGLLIRIDNPGKRNIRFRLNGRSYAFDPNRIFSKAGIEQTLRSLGRYNLQARAEVEKFAQRILAQIPRNVKYVIALHNNSEGFYSIRSYHTGNEKSSDAKDIHHNEEHDEDDLFYTTDSTWYTGLKTGGFNCVLQNNKKARRDGSLSIYFGDRKIPYLNCETEHGRTEQFEKMVRFALNTFN